MPRFRVETRELVTGVYFIERDTADKARSDFESMTEPRLPEDAEQVEYMAFGLEVRDIVQVGP